MKRLTKFNVIIDCGENNPKTWAYGVNLGHSRYDDAIEMAVRNWMASNSNEYAYIDSILATNTVGKWTLIHDAYDFIRRRCPDLLDEPNLPTLDRKPIVGVVLARQ